MVVGVFFLPRARGEGGRERELKKRNKRKDSEGTERGLSPEEMIKKHVWRRHKPRNVYVTCLSFSLSPSLLRVECKICGSGSRSRASSSFPLSLSLFLLRSLSHLFCPSFCFSNFTLSALFTYTIHLSISSPSILLHLFFFCSSLKSDFNGSCQGYYTSSVILLREIFIRRKEEGGRGLDEGRLASIREARSPRRFLLIVFINSYVCLIVFSRIILPIISCLIIIIIGTH